MLSEKAFSTGGFLKKIGIPTPIPKPVADFFVQADTPCLNLEFPCLDCSAYQR